MVYLEETKARGRVAAVAAAAETWIRDEAAPMLADEGVASQGMQDGCRGSRRRVSKSGSSSSRGGVGCSSPQCDVLLPLRQSLWP